MILPLASECRRAYFFKETTDPKKVHPNLIQEFPIEQSGRCSSSGGGNQREPNTSPIRILLGLSFDALFLPIRRVPPALCRSRCFKNQAGLHSRPKQPLPTPLLALPVTTELLYLRSMPGENVNELHQLFFASKHGGLVNKNGGCYLPGKSYGLDVKLFVAATCFDKGRN